MTLEKHYDLILLNQIGMGRLFENNQDILERKEIIKIDLNINIY